MLIIWRGLRVDNETINIYIDKISKGQSYVDVRLFDEVKEIIYSKYGQDFKYINYHVIEHIDREIQQLNKYEINQEIKEENRIKIVLFIKNILNDTAHPLQQYLSEAIKQSDVNFVWGDNGNQILSINAIIRDIIFRFKLLELITEDEKILIMKKRDKHKINDAIKLLQIVSDDVHLLYHLDNIKKTKLDEQITKTNILGSIFYQFTKLLDKDFSLNKSQVQKYSNDIMTQVFEVTKDYRIYKKTKDFRYKEFYLTRYIS